MSSHHHHHKITNLLQDLQTKASNILHINSQKDVQDMDGSSHNPEHYLATSELLEVPAHGPKRDVSSLKPVLHGPEDPSPYLDPLDENVRLEIIKYGEFVQATYDGFDFNSSSNFCGSGLYGMDRMLDKLGLKRYGYIVTKYLYAMSHVNLPSWLENAFHPNAWNYESNWMGYVAVSGDAESKRIGCRDVLVAWRGTYAISEWFRDMDLRFEHLGEHIKVEHGFYSIYTSKSEDAKYNQTSAQEQVLEELRRLISYFKNKGEDVCLTLGGHSLGAALCFLTAYDALQEFEDLQISIFTFGGPRVGNKHFCDKLEERNVKVIRVVVKHDLVPRLPGVFFNKEFEKIKEITHTWHSLYTHYGHELRLQVDSSPYLNNKWDALGFHNLEMYLHLVDGHISSAESGKFREDAKRDVALVNKSSGMLKEETLVPSCWFQPAFKGLVRNRYGRWVIPERDPEDLPPPPDTVVDLSVFD